MAAAQVYAGGVTSGAHYNPAVTLAVLVCRKLVEFYSSSERLKKRLVEPLAVMFMITQCVTALCAAALRVWCWATLSAPPRYSALTTMAS